MNKKVLTIVGTRPEVIKMAPVIREISLRGSEFDSVVCSTGQHRQMLDQSFEIFGLKPDLDLGLMTPNQTLSGLTAQLFTSLDSVLKEVKPDWVLAQGDTTTVFVACMVAYYHKIKFGHVEAGLRTGQKYSPFPEEVNRRVADHTADILFAPTADSKSQLLREGISEDQILVTGNTVIDAVQWISNRASIENSEVLSRIPRGIRNVLITAHRRESFGKPFEDLCQAIRSLALRFKSSDVQFIYPVHLNPNVQEPVRKILGDLDNVFLLEPLDYVNLVALLKQSTLVLTDSGGIQEEAPGLGVPVLVMRDVTERPEGIRAGVARLVGTSPDRIVAEASRLLEDPSQQQAMKTAVSPYGDGKASARIADYLAVN